MNINKTSQILDTLFIDFLAVITEKKATKIQVIIPPKYKFIQYQKRIHFFIDGVFHWIVFTIKSNTLEIAYKDDKTIHSYFHIDEFKEYELNTPK